MQEQPQQEYAVDQWIIEFANLFREHTGASHVLWHAYLTNFPVLISALHQHLSCTLNSQWLLALQ